VLNLQSFKIINMKLVLASTIIILLCIFFLCINILFKKNGQFPKTHVSQNSELRKKGITCVQTQYFSIRKKNNRIKEHS